MESSRWLCHSSSSASQLDTARSPLSDHAAATTPPSESALAVTPTQLVSVGRSRGSVEDRQRAEVVRSSPVHRSLNFTVPINTEPPSVRAETRPWISWSAATMAAPSSTMEKGSSPRSRRTRPSSSRVHTSSRRGSVPAARAAALGPMARTSPAEAPPKSGSASRPMFTTMAMTTRITMIPPARITNEATRSFCGSVRRGFKGYFPILASCSAAVAASSGSNPALITTRWPWAERMNRRYSAVSRSRSLFGALLT